MSQTYGGVRLPAPVQAEMGGTPPMMCLANIQKLTIAGRVQKLDSDPVIDRHEKKPEARYRVCREDGVSEEVFYGIEQADCCTRCTRQCCPDCAPWKINLLYTQSGANTIAFKMQRPFTCTCCCFNRPVVEMQDAVTNQSLGFIKDPFACCDTRFVVRDPGGHDVLKAKPRRMGPCGLCCPLPCCTQLDFAVRDADSGTEVGQIQKKLTGHCRCNKDANVSSSYLTFDGVQHPQFKALLMGLCVYLDYRYFHEEQWRQVAKAPDRGDEDKKDEKADGGAADEQSDKEDGKADKDGGSSA